MITWQELLTQFRSPGTTTLGPFTEQLASATLALQEAMWFANAGYPLEEDDLPATQVASWHDVIAAITDADRNGVSGFGHLRGPEQAIASTLDEHPERSHWVDVANSTALGRVSVRRFVPEHIRMPAVMELTDHVHTFYRWLFAEIVVQDVTACTYFREQLAWWHAGHVPCGWDGNWPAGRMRVF